MAMGEILSSLWCREVILTHNKALARSRAMPSSAVAMILSNQRRQLHATSISRTSHFDTHAFVEKLERQGMTRVQAEGVMTVLAEVVDESIKGMEISLVSKAEQEKVCHLLLSNSTIRLRYSPIIAVKSDSQAFQCITW